MTNEKPSVVLTVKTKITASIETVWEALSNPKQIQQWNFANPEWHCPNAVNKFVEGGSFCYKMEAKDGSAGFDLEGKFTKIEMPEEIHYTLADGRMVKVTCSPTTKSRTIVVQSFEAESENSLDLQQTGWQNVLDNLKEFVESQA